MNRIRNFCIIAHIDHGKSTLADRLLELTGTIDKRKMKEQVLDTMDLERERGITIKLQPARMKYTINGEQYVLNLIDTPGHVDFSYEVSRSLAAVEGALLVIDATQGIQAQTLANLYLALGQNLEIIPILNKIDLPVADVKTVSQEVIHLLGCREEDILLVSAKTGEGVDKVLEAIVNRIPNSQADWQKSLQALIFDSKFDDYKGVIAYVRLINGNIKPGDHVRFIEVGVDSEIIEVGYFSPAMVKSNGLNAGEIGYIVTGLKNLEDCHVGDTISSQTQKAKALPGYKAVKPMVFAGLFCKEGNDYKELREALAKLKLTDASLVYGPEASPALGFGFRCGFLGLLHLEIVQERIKREYGLDLIITVPSVAYRVYYAGDKSPVIIHSPQELGNLASIVNIEEPWVKVDIITPKEFLGNIMTLVAEKMGEHKNTEYLSENSALLHYQLPLSSILTDFYDKLKSASRGYASLNYEFLDYRQADVERLDILVAEEPVDALATIVYSDSAYQSAKKIVNSLKDILPRQMFEVKIQACLGYQNTGKNKGGKIIASARIPAMRKDVTAKLYGGDVTRKRKLLEKQKKGKKKMKSLGKVDIPAAAYIAVLKR
ncbi:elongation factor 4 [Candidatus Kuenenbacteria bacterium CG11_big_fil_rev_8_21_14_0_20_37_9]|uniref:Elongation factor 4 n=2 Tax=Candidatus Kueneniibacteriota TaxID=1752740 RepID=A0A2M6XSM5_9BACT|nr:MAG: elongation factor 4 [Candidatus Kuenenbacteria bacterium CG1_02_38_13]PIR05666.1 MAG: elongation factor 4 [Candidatus Kuenenbacteria bacterium CG11_big_fil_rev_8_21_14_0_20_37_9]PIU10637.1 MAG: elongation factor 4 [Candidatus Kuenenbacteria bacterium CG08_land_8_20_14_0_20_37_23]